jgi:hypothetical protein
MCIPFEPGDNGSGGLTYAQEATGIIEIQRGVWLLRVLAPPPPQGCRTPDLLQSQLGRGALSTSPHNSATALLVILLYNEKRITDKKGRFVFLTLTRAGVQNVTSERKPR